jgi:hypothetical protein
VDTRLFGESTTLKTFKFVCCTTFVTGPKTPVTEYGGKFLTNRLFLKDSVDTNDSELDILLLFYKYDLGSFFNV